MIYTNALKNITQIHLLGKKSHWAPWGKLLSLLSAQPCVFQSRPQCAWITRKGSSLQPTPSVQAGEVACALEKGICTIYRGSEDHHVVKKRNPGLPTAWALSICSVLYSHVTGPHPPVTSFYLTFGFHRSVSVKRISVAREVSQRTLPGMHVALLCGDNEDSEHM